MTITTKKVYQFLNYLQSFFKEERGESLSGLCRRRKVPTEYATWIVDECLLLKQGGLRGPARYVWNPEKKPTIGMAEILRARYIEIRGDQDKLHKQTILSVLMELNKKIDALTRTMESIKRSDNFLNL